jgi:hypothetical protein
MLYIVYPLAFIYDSIFSLESSIAMSYVLRPISVVNCAISPHALANSKTAALNIKLALELSLIDVNQLSSDLLHPLSLRILLKVVRTHRILHGVNLLSTI